jgi:hypothetical protein
MFSASGERRGGVWEPLPARVHHRQFVVDPVHTWGGVFTAAVGTALRHRVFEAQAYVVHTYAWRMCRGVWEPPRARVSETRVHRIKAEPARRVAAVYKPAEK